MYLSNYYGNRIDSYNQEQVEIVSSNDLKRGDARVRTVMHGGEVDGHSSYLAFSRERALGIVVLSNLGGRAADGLGGWLERELPGLKPF